MRGLDLSLGAEVDFQGRRFIMSSTISFDEVEGRDPTTGLHERLPVVDLTEPREEAEGTVVSDLSTIDSRYYEEAKRRQRVVEELLALPRRRRADVKQKADELGVSASALYAWMRQYRMDDRLTTLLPARPDGGRGKSRLDPAVERAIQLAIEKHLTPQQLSARATVREARRLCRAAKLEPPHENTIRARINAISEKTRLQMRGHKKEAEDKHSPKAGRYDDATKPLDVVQIDHTQVDIILVDEEHRLPLRRPWITVAFDVFSRMVLGFYVSFDEPGALATGLCIAGAILPKEKWLARYNIPHEWPCWGFPQKLHADNGKDFRGDMVKRACDQYGITSVFRAIKKPRYGGHIERYLGTFARAIHELPGAAMKPSKRGEYDSEAEAVFTLREFEEIVAIHVTSIYHQSFHSGINSSPLEKWNRAILGDEKHPGCGLFPRPVDEERLYIDFMPIEERTIQNYGVAIDKVRYYSDVLRPFIRDARNGSRMFTFRRDPRDISSIYFWDPDLSEYARIPYRNITHPAISIWELNAVRKSLEEQGRANIDEDAIFDAYERLREHQERAKAETKHVRRLHERKKTLERERAQKPPPRRREVEQPPIVPRFGALKPLPADDSATQHTAAYDSIVPLEIEEMG
jgi:putative transposase